MDIGEVGFFVEKNVKYETTTKDNSFIKYINKTREERLVDFEAEKDSYYKEIENKKLKFYEDKVSFIFMILYIIIYHLLILNLSL